MNTDDSCNNSNHYNDQDHQQSTNDDIGINAGGKSIIKSRTRTTASVNPTAATNFTTVATYASKTTMSSGSNLSTSNKMLFKITFLVLVLYFIMSWWILVHDISKDHVDLDLFTSSTNSAVSNSSNSSKMSGTFDSDKNYNSSALQLPVVDLTTTTTTATTRTRTTTFVNNPNVDERLDETKRFPDEIMDQLRDSSTSAEHVVDVSAHQQYQLMAFLEPINQQDWAIKPLPVRNTTSSMLQQRTFGRIACSTLPQQWPTDEDEAPTNQDPFLPWIHDVFPTADGKFIQFVAQNKRRCQSGTTKTSIKDFMQPNIALFQHVPVTRVYNYSTGTSDGAGIGAGAGAGNDSSIRYRISSHEEADPDGIETRFICRFKPSMEETLSVHNLNYDYHTVRKAYKATFTQEGFDNHMIWTSQLLFKCPVPESLQEQVRLGTLVVDDYATHFVDLVPIRTPPRYGSPTRYLPPRLFSDRNDWDPSVEWGNHHILPRIEDSGRWENIPICKPSLMTYPDQGPMDVMDREGIAAHDKQMAELAQNNTKKRLIACTWTSSLFETRGGKTKVSDGDQRLLQWLEFNKLVGIEHVYVYDNSGAFSETDSLKSVTDLFPGFATRIDWPAKVCNNRPGNTDNKGERSSQYAAAMSCHLRFGVHTDWLMAVDTDEYMVPMGEHDSLKDLLMIADQEDIKVLNWKSKRSKPRLQYFK